MQKQGNISAKQANHAAIYVVARTWHYRRTSVTRSCHSRGNIVAHLWHNTKVNDIFFARSTNLIFFSRVEAQKGII